MRFSIGIIGIVASIFVLSGCGGDDPIKKSRDNAPGHERFKDCQMIIIDHRYSDSKFECENGYSVSTDLADFAIYVTDKEYHCSDYGRKNDYIECGEQDMYNSVGIADCIFCSNIKKNL